MVAGISGLSGGAGPCFLSTSAKVDLPQIVYFFKTEKYILIPSDIVVASLLPKIYGAYYLVWKAT